VSKTLRKTSSLLFQQIRHGQDISIRTSALNLEEDSIVTSLVLIGVKESSWDNELPAERSTYIESRDHLSRDLTRKAIDIYTVYLIK
jgi:hypothetical protein